MVARIFTSHTGTSPVMRPHGAMTQLKVSPFPPEQIREMIEGIMSERVRSKFADTGNVEFSCELSGEPTGST